MTTDDQPLSAELIDDRALKRAEQDLLGHNDVVEELAELVNTVKAPASIALFGPWGAGKSSLANLLKPRVKSRGLAFARFDAFKYAETPLRRHFLSQVAKHLEVDDRRYTEGLYSTRTDTTIKLKWKEVAQIVAIFLGAALLVEVVALLLVVILAGISSGSFGRNFAATIDSGLAFGAIPAALVGAIVALAARTFSVERSRSAPSSEEEFGRLFEELIEGVQEARVVVFIDELDRCSPEEVVTTLETIRTFLDVSGCVVVVAADHQVLERALQRRARQETPLDRTNPYFTAGSAYLDKIFQYQLSLPPLMARRAEEFALRLVGDRGGLWREVDVERVIFALLPTHVKSPRRVKVLLNAFVIAYRLARRRARGEALAMPIADRADEIAKLVCLRTEFPLFAADLAIDARLTEYVLDFDRGGREALPDHLAPHVRRLAECYATGMLPPDLLIARDKDARRRDDQSSDPEPDDAAAGRESAAVREEHTQQLLAYLHKTAQQVPGPRRDLVHLEGGGATFGLDGELADQIEDAAKDGRGEALIEILAALDEAQRVAGLRLLARTTREAPLGPQGANAVSVLLTGIARFQEPVEQIADELADAVATQQERLRLRPEDLYPAYLLSLRSGRRNRAQLQSAVLDDDECLTNSELALLVLSEPREVLEARPERVGEIAAGILVEHPDDLARTLLSLDDRVAVRLTEATQAAIQSGLEPTPVEDVEGEAYTRFNLDAVISALGVTLDRLLAKGARHRAEALADTLLSLDSKGARNAYDERADKLGAIASPALTLRVLSAVRQRPIATWPRWLGALRRRKIADRVWRDETRRLLRVLWRQTAQDPDPENVEQVSAALDAVVVLAGKRKIQREDLTDRVVPSLRDQPLDPAGAPGYGALLDAARRFESSGVANGAKLRAARLEKIAEALSAPHPAQPLDSDLVRLVDEEARGLVDQVTSDEREAMCDRVHGCPWLPSPLRESTAIELAAARAQIDGTREPLYTSSAVRELLVTYGERSISAAGSWLAELAATNEDALLVCEPFGGRTLPRPLTRGLRAYLKRQRPQVANELLEMAIGAPEHDDSRLNVLTAIGGARYGQAHAASRIVALARYASNHPLRKRTLAVWRALAPGDDAARRRLVSEVAIAIAQEGKGAHDLVVSNLDLCVPPPYGTKKRLIETLRGGASGRQQKRRTDRALLEQGLIKRSGLLGRGREMV